MPLSKIVIQAKVVIAILLLTQTENVLGQHAEITIVNQMLDTPIHRSLLTSSCNTVSIQGKNYEFANCIDLSQTLGLANPFVVSYTLEKSQNGSTLFKGAIVAKPLGWVGLGFPNTPISGMLGASTVIINPNSKSPTGAVVNGVKLRDFSPTTINRELGNYPLNDTAAERASDGTLRAVFTAELPDVYDTIDSSTRRIIYSMGVMNGDLLESHITTDKTSYPYGRADVELSTTPTSGVAIAAHESCWAVVGYILLLVHLLL